jgi:vacuolar-type H+-ATPase subunit F/Vma7
VIGERALTSGMELAGIKYSRTATNQIEAEEAVKGVLDSGDVGIVIINSRVSSMVKERKLRRAIESGVLPIFVEVPGYGEAVWEGDQLRKLIMRAIGIDISAK